MARHSSQERLVRLLSLPAWVDKHPGATLEEASAHYEVSTEQLRADITTLWMTGLPELPPGELVDFDGVALERGVLVLTQPLGLDDPVRLSRQEAAALVLALRSLRPLLAGLPGSLAVLDSVLDVVLAASGTLPSPASCGTPPALAEWEDEDREAVTAAAGPHAPAPSASLAGPTRPQVLEPVTQAMREGHGLHLRYADATDAPSERDVEPLSLSSDGTHLTLLAWCHRARAERRFRLDRVLEAKPLPDLAVTHSPRRRSRPGGKEAWPTAQLHLAPSGRWVAEQLGPEQVTEHPDGSLDLQVRGRDEEWLVRLVLSAGRHIRSVRPEWLARRVAAQAREALRAYDQG